MKSEQKYGLAPFAILTFIYFIVGFLTTVNGQFQGPLKIAFLSGVTTLRNTMVTLIPFFFFLGYLLNSSIGGRWIDRFGYKTTLMRALSTMIIAIGLYLGASYMATSFAESGLMIGGDYVPYGYLVFLLGSFLMGTSVAILQVVINPYVSSYNLPNTQPVQRLNIVGAINSFGTTIAPFFVTGVMFAGVPMDSVESGQLIIPFIAMGIFVTLVTIVTYMIKLPNIEGTYNEDLSKQQRSIWSFRHLRLGVVAIFFYVGAEVSIGVNVNLHAIELIERGQGLNFFGHDNVILFGLEFGIPALLATLYWGGFMVGRTMSSFVRKISPRRQLIFTVCGAIILTIIAILSGGNLWVLVAVGLCHSIMWSAIFTLSIKGLKEYTSKASGVFMMGVFGGAVFPLIQGGLADWFGSWQWTWCMVIVCELVILYYAIYGSRIKENLI